MDELTCSPQCPAQVWEECKRSGHLPKLPDCPLCMEKQGVIVMHAPNGTSRQHTLHLDTGCWDDVSVDGKKYFAVAGVRVKHEDSYVVVPYFLPVENKSGCL